MREVKPSIGINDYEKYLREKFPQHSSEWISSLIIFFFSFHTLSAEENNAMIAKDFIEALRDVNEDVTEELDQEKSTELERFALQILEAEDSLGVSAKATRLMLQNERTFISSEIISDMRSVFPNDESNMTPTAAVIIHSLRIHSDSSNEERENFFIAMDYGDLLELQRTVERALKKHKGLSKMLDEFRLRHVEVGGVEK